MDSDLVSRLWPSDHLQPEDQVDTGDGAATSNISSCDCPWIAECSESFSVYDSRSRLSLSVCNLSIGNGECHPQFDTALQISFPLHGCFPKLCALPCLVWVLELCRGGVVSLRDLLLHWNLTPMLP